MSPRARFSRGYTAVELLMAISIFAIGVSGVIAMQKVTVGANKYAKNLAMATHIGQAWLDQLSADAATWNHPSPKNPSPDLGTDTTWLKVAGTTPGVWVRPAYEGMRLFGSGFTGLGDPLPDTSLADAVFCTEIRLSWLYPATGGNGLLRAEVRVFWQRDGQATLGGLPICDAGTLPSAVDGAGDKYHFVHLASAVKQNTAP